MKHTFVSGSFLNRLNSLSRSTLLAPLNCLTALRFLAPLSHLTPLSRLTALRFLGTSNCLRAVEPKMFALGVAVLSANACPLLASQVSHPNEFTPSAQVLSTAIFAATTQPVQSVTTAQPIQSVSTAQPVQSTTTTQPVLLAPNSQSAKFSGSAQTNAQANVQASVHVDTTSRAETGQIVTLRSSDFTKVKDYHIMNTLAGKVPGLTIHTNSIGMGAAPHVQIRGIYDLNLENSPLYIVDGMPIYSHMTQVGFSKVRFGGGLSLLNIDDIEDISIIKGFTPLLLNGNIGPNGVVMITTKRGHAGKLSINYSNSTQFSSPFIMPKFQNTYGPSYSVLSWGPKLNTPSEYDPEDFFRTGFCTMNTLSVSGGNKYNQTYASVGMANGNNILPKNRLDRYNATLRNSLSLLDGRLRINLGAMWAKSKEKNTALSGYSNDLLRTLYLFPRGEKIDQVKFNDKLMSECEEYNSEIGLHERSLSYSFFEKGFENPYWTVNHKFYPTENKKYMLDAGVNYQITNWLSVSGNYRYESTHSFQNWKQDPSLVYGPNFRQYYETVTSKDNLKTSLNTYQLQANVYKKVHDFSFSGALGFFYAKEFYYNDFHSEYFQENLSGQHFGEGYATYYCQLNNSQRSLSSMIGVGYKDMYFVHLKNNLYKSAKISPVVYKNSIKSFLPNVGTSFVLSEIFPIKSDFLSYLRLNGSYAVNGDYKPFYSKFVFGVGLSDVGLDIMDFQKTKQGEISLDGRLFNNLLDFNISLYQSDTKSSFRLPPSGGYSDPVGENDKIQNKGIEISLGIHRPLGCVQWNSLLNYSLNRTKIKNVSEETSRYSYLQKHDYPQLFKLRNVEGEAYGDIYGIDFCRDSRGLIDVDPNKLILNGPSQYTRLGNIMPKWCLSWYNDFSWKGITLGMLINARIGGECCSYTEAQMDYFGVSKASGTDRDRGEVNVSGYKIPVKNYYKSLYSVSVPYIYSATNIRLAELSLGYDVPIERWTKFVKGVNVSFVGRNLLMLYNKAPFDPELITHANGLNLGIDDFMLPSLRSIGFALNVRF